MGGQDVAYIGGGVVQSDRGSCKGHERGDMGRERGRQRAKVKAEQHSAAST
jgi:hypothetical protein